MTGGAVTPLICTTPCVVQVNRSDQLFVLFKKEGYDNVGVHLRNEPSGKGVAATSVGNVIAGGIIGVGVDLVTSAAFSHVPNPVIAEMKREGSAPRLNDPNRPQRQGAWKLFRQGANDPH